jgi:murein DD-endopeptidase MepM/ murein hydrolase activator NlpD
VLLVAAACIPADDEPPPFTDSLSATGEPAPGVVVRVDTIVRVDTVVLVDTIFGDRSTGGAEAPPSALEEMPAPTEQDLLYLRSRRLVVPVSGVSARDIPSSFADMRGQRRHNAIDILAPRGTAVLSADDGIVAKIDTSAGGGLSLYIAEPRERFIFYYAHLDRYRPGLTEGMSVRKGDTIGYVGTTGNAPPNVPHLHFAIALAHEDKRWWSGTPLDPLPLLRGADQR